MLGQKTGPKKKRRPFRRRPRSGAFIPRYPRRELVERVIVVPATMTTEGQAMARPGVRNIAAEQLAACKNQYSMYRRLADRVFSAERAINETQIERHMGDITRREYRTLKRAIMQLRNFGIQNRGFDGLGQITVSTNEDIEAIRKKSLLTGTVLGFALGAAGVYLIRR